MENQIIEAEFKVVQERTLDVIATEIRIIDGQVCQVVLNGAVEIGQRLAEAKEKIGHGNWETWCRENLNYSKSKAERFMKISTEYGKENSLYLSAISKTSTSTDFSIYKALALLQVPENEVEDFTENNKLEELKVKDLEAEIKKLKEEKQASENQNKTLEELEEKLKNIEAERDEGYILLQALKEKELEANNGELSPEAKAEVERLGREIAKFKANCEKAEKREKALKEEKSKLEATQKEEIEKVKKQALEEATDFAVKRAEEQMGDKVTELTAKIETAERRAADAEKDLEIVGSETLLKRKANMGLIVTLVKEIKDSIKELREQDSAQAEELSQKTKSFILTLVDLF